MGPRGVVLATLVAGLLGWWQLARADGHALTLADAVASALHRGDEARIARLESGQAADALGEARSAYLPRLEVTSGAGYSNRQNEKLRALNARGEEKVYGLRTLGASDGWINVEIEQLLFDLGTWRRAEQSELAAEAARVAEDERHDATAEDVLIRYVRVLRLEERLRLAEERAERLGWLENQARLLLEAGRAVPTERDQIALAAQEAALDDRTRSAELAEARAALQLSIGDPAADVSSLDAASLPVAEPPGGDLASDEALAATPALRVLDLRRRTEERGVAAARADRYPTIGLQAAYANYGPNRYDNYPDELRVNVAFRVALFDGNRASYAIANAAKGAEIAQLRYRAMIESKRARVRELARLLGAAREAPSIAARRAAIARERVRLADLSLQAERGSLAEALAARETLAHDAAEAVDAPFDRVETWASLMRETGQLAHALLGGPFVPAPDAP